MPANESEHNNAVEEIEKAMKNSNIIPDAICADAAYGSGNNCAAMEKRGIRLVSRPPKAKTHTGDKYFSTENFVYDENKDVFICPAGEILKYIGDVKARPHQRRYAGLRSICRKCKLKDKCTKSDRCQSKVGVSHASLIRLRADSRTESFNKLYKSRAPVIEGIFAEAKENHGLRRAWRRGLLKMQIQALLIGSVLNFKRLAAVFCPLIGPKTYLKTAIRLILTIVERFWNKVSQNSPFKINIDSSKY